MPEQTHRPINRVDECNHVLELALDVVGAAVPVAALAAASPVHGVDGEMFLQFGLDELPGQVVRCRAMHQNQRWTLAATLVGYGSAISRGNHFHVVHYLASSGSIPLGWSGWSDYGSLPPRRHRAFTLFSVLLYLLADEIVLHGEHGGRRPGRGANLGVDVLDVMAP